MQRAIITINYDDVIRNKDVINSLFPSIEVKSIDDDYVVVGGSMFYCPINKIHREWWEAPYEGGL
jgi:hypothetical protein